MNYIAIEHSSYNAAFSFFCLGPVLFAAKQKYDLGNICLVDFIVLFRALCVHT